jgi:hypothetical protein
MTDKIATQFWAKVDKSAGPDGCWPWVGAKFPRGYGNFRGVRANRLAYALANGTDPRELHVCHSCDNPPCCNPAILFLGTVADNMHDRDRKGRQVLPRIYGEAHPKAKLTNDNVETIRRMICDGETNAAIARAFGVSATSISLIRSGKNWKCSLMRKSPILDSKP